jgi:glycolate oxidase FAD binding subunit
VVVIPCPPIVDGLIAARLATPDLATEAAGLLREAAINGLSVVPFGGGRAMGMGDRLASFDLAVSTERLCEVVAYTPDDLAVTVEAGCTVDVLNDHLRQFHQFVALDPYGGPGHTVGGVIASGWSGPLRLGFGPVRDQVLGLRVALPDGTLFRAGGRTVKNVSGYDLHKLHVGALGSFGLIVEATLRVWPVPRGDRTFSVEAEDWEACWAATRRVRRLRVSPIAMVVERVPDGRFTIHARYAGPGVATQTVAHELGWDEVSADWWGESARRRSGLWARLAVPPSRLPEIVAQLDTGTVIVEPSIGIAHWLGAVDSESLDRVRQIAEGASGSLVLMSAPATVKDQIGAWGSPPSTLPLMGRLRDQFDPGRTISPGRYPV